MGADIPCSSGDQNLHSSLLLAARLRDDPENGFTVLSALVNTSSSARIAYSREDRKKDPRCPLPKGREKMPVSTIHPFVVHFAIALSCLAGAMEILPGVFSGISEKGRSLVWNGALLSLLLAVLTGWGTLRTLEGRIPHLPDLVRFHRLAGISALGLVLILRVVRSESDRLPSGEKGRQDGLKRALALATILLVLGTATMGGHLVYHDHLGTAFWPPSGASPP
jgi:uncharacterized membrane protein